MKNKPYFLQEACNLVYPKFMLVNYSTAGSCLFQVLGTGTLLVTYVVASQEVQNTYQMSEIATTIQVPAGSEQINLVGDITGFQCIQNVYELVADKSSVEYISPTSMMESLSITRCHALLSISGGLDGVGGQLCLRECAGIRSIDLTSVVEIDIANCFNITDFYLGVSDHPALIPAITILGKTSINNIVYAGNYVADHAKLIEVIIALIESSTVESGYVDCTELNIDEEYVEEFQEIVTTYGWTISLP